MRLFQVKLHSWGQQRCLAEAAVAPKALDWDSLESSIASDDGKRDLASLRSTWIDVEHKFDSMEQVSSAVRSVSHHGHRFRPFAMGVQSGGDIDWKSYEKEVDPEVLKMFKDSFSCKSLHAARGS